MTNGEYSDLMKEHKNVLTNYSARKVAARDEKYSWQKKEWPI